jgi:hypothetical protein
MARSIATATAAEIVKPVLEGAMLARFDWPGETIRVWAGVGTLTWGGEQYLGTGVFGRVSQIEETTEASAAGASFELSTIPPYPGDETAWDLPTGLMQQALTDHIQGRDAEVWFAAFDQATGLIVGEPVQLVRAYMDTLTLSEDGTSSRLTLATEGRLRDDHRMIRRIYGSADQQREYPGDRGFEYAAALPNTIFPWGEPAATEGDG